MYGILSVLPMTKRGDEMKLYVNGELRKSDPYNIQSVSDWGSEQNWYIGRSNWDDLYFHGVIDEFYLYDRVLPEAEVKALYESTR